MNAHPKPTNVKPVPEGYHTVTLALSIKGCAEAVEFYKKAFGAQETGPRIMDPSGIIGHTETRIGDSRIMMADEYPEYGIVSPKTLGGVSVTITLYVEDVDAVVNKAVEAGATVSRPVENQFYGDRAGQVIDPFGYRWAIHTHIEDIPDHEMLARAAKLYG